MLKPTQMKKLLPVLLLNLFYCSCKENNIEVKYSINVAVAGDITDPLSLLPAAEPILKLYEFDRNKNAEADFRLSTITDKHLNPAIQYHLPEGSVTEKDNDQDDPNFREKLILSFYETMKRAISNFDTASHLDSSLNHSECFSLL